MHWLRDRTREKEQRIHRELAQCAAKLPEQSQLSPAIYKSRTDRNTAGSCYELFDAPFDQTVTRRGIGCGGLAREENKAAAPWTGGDQPAHGFDLRVNLAHGNAIGARRKVNDGCRPGGKFGNI